MADNVTVTAGAGTTIATDDVGSVHYQRVKLDVGGDGATVPVVSTKVAVPTSDNGPYWTSAYLHTASADATGGADVTAAPTGGQKIVIDDVIVSVDTAMKVTFECETTGTDVIVLFMAANSAAQVTPRGQIKLATADKKLRVVAGAAGNIAITIVYHSEA